MCSPHILIVQLYQKKIRFLSLDKPTKHFIINHNRDVQNHPKYFSHLPYWDVHYYSLKKLYRSGLINHWNMDNPRSNVVMWKLACFLSLRACFQLISHRIAMEFFRFEFFCFCNGNCFVLPIFNVYTFRILIFFKDLFLFGRGSYSKKQNGEIKRYLVFVVSLPKCCSGVLIDA